MTVLKLTTEPQLINDGETAVILKLGDAKGRVIIGESQNKEKCCTLPEKLNTFHIGKGFTMFAWVNYGSALVEILGNSKGHIDDIYHGVLTGEIDREQFSEIMLNQTKKFEW